MFTNTAELPAVVGRSRRPIETPRWNPMMHVLITASLLCALRATGILVSSTSHERDFTVPAGVITDFGLRLSHGGLYRGEVTAATVRVGEPQSWVVRLEQRNHHRAAYAALQARVWMPETGIESAVRPTVTYIGGGGYRVDDMLFTRSGWWNVALIVDGRSGVDSLAFNVRVP